MNTNHFFRLLARLRVGHKLLLIYLLDLSAVIYISGILIHEKYLAIDFSNKEIVGNAYVRVVTSALIDVTLTGAGQRLPPAAWRATIDQLAAAEAQYGEPLQSAALNRTLRDALQALSLDRQPDAPTSHAALDACRELITRIGNQSNLILDPDLDSYYTMSQSILRYPPLIDAVNGIGRHLHEGRTARSREEVRTRYLVLEGQLDAAMQGLRSDFAEAPRPITRWTHRLRRRSRACAQRSMPFVMRRASSWTATVPQTPRRFLLSILRSNRSSPMRARAGA